MNTFTNYLKPLPSLCLNDESDGKEMIIEQEDLTLGDIQSYGDGYSLYSGVVKNKKSPYYRRTFAVKVIHPLYGSDATKIRQMLHIESSIFRNCSNHPFITSMHSAFQNNASHSIAFVLDPYLPRSLGDILEQKKRLPHIIVVRYMAELLSILIHLHRNGIAFRQLEPQHITFDSAKHVQMVHFNGAQIYNPLKCLKYENKENSGVRNNGMSGVLCGDKKCICTYPYASRSLAVLIYQCLVGERLSNIDRINDIKFPSYVSDSARDIILRLLQPDFKKRLGRNGLTDICNDPFFRGVDWDWRAMESVDIIELWKQSLRKANNPIRSKPDLRSEVLSSTLSTAAAEIVGFHSWQSLLKSNETIVLSSDVELHTSFWRMKRMQSGVLLFTDMRRLVFIRKGAIASESPQSKIISVDISNEDTFVLKTVKKTLTVKVLGTTAQQWKDILQSWH